jgi:SET and MYND domain-containing protein 4
MEWLALKIVTKASFKYLSSVKEALFSYENKYERGNLIRAESSILSPEEKQPKKYKSDSYYNVFHLITNSFLRRSNDLFRRSYVALFLTKILIKTGFISNVKTPAELKENACFIGGLVLRHLQSISCNAHEISQLKLDDDLKKPLEKGVCKPVGAGIYALLSIFNHSCEPHVTRNFVGSRCQVRMIRNANKNEEIFDNYGVIYAVNTSGEREDKLCNQYFFTCRCRACNLSWPLFEKIPNDFKAIGIRCSECNNEKDAKKGCSACENELDSVRVFQYLSEKAIDNLLVLRESLELNELPTQKKIALIYDSFCEYLQVLDEYKIKRPFRDINDYQEALKQCLNLIHLIINKDF